MSPTVWRWIMFVGFTVTVATCLMFLERLGWFTSVYIGGLLGYLMAQVVVDG